MTTSRRRFIASALAGAGGLWLERAVAWARPRSARRKNPLFSDRFRRHDASGWGGAWFNQRYGRRWSVDGAGAAYVLPASVNKKKAVEYRPNPIFVLDHDVADVDIRAVMSTSNATARLGLVARATTYADYYAAHVGNGILRISRCDHHDERVLGKTIFLTAPYVHYVIRMEVKGSETVTVRAKVWPAGTREPTDWSVTVRDSGPAIRGAGPFGVFAGHALDLTPATLRVSEFVADSGERGSVTTPAITYSLVGPPDGSSIRAVAKTSVPASISFQVAPDETFSSGVETFQAGRTSRRAQTAKARLDTSRFVPSSRVHWRAIATRGGKVFTGPPSSFSTAPIAGLPMTFAFGACTKWRTSPHPSFEQATRKGAAFFLHQGDFGYVPYGVIDHAADTYQDHWVRMLMDPNLALLTRSMPFGFYQDDADYGRNEANSRTLRKFTIDAWDELNANPPGPYFTFHYGDVTVITVNCRRFSTGKGVPAEQRSKLGDEQKAWLRDQLRAAASENPGLIILASTQTLGSDANKGSWRRAYPNEWREIIDLLEGLNTPVLIISGDTHGHKLYQYPQKELSPGIPRMVEFLSAGTEQNKFHNDIDERFLLKEARKVSGFGLVELGPEQNTAGQYTRVMKLTACRSSDGSPLWSQSYLIVKGLGLFPLAA